MLTYNIKALFISSALFFNIHANADILSNGELKLSDHKFTITDGDSIRVGNYRLRMLYIDAPESPQECYTLKGESWACGQEAAEHLRNLVGDGHKVTCNITGIDKYKRNLAVCYKDKLNINKQMVEDGYAMAYINYGSPYIDEQDKARSNKLGIWSGTFLDPQVYRKNKGHLNQKKQSKGEKYAQDRRYNQDRKEL